MLVLIVRVSLHGMVMVSMVMAFMVMVGMVVVGMVVMVSVTVMIMLLRGATPGRRRPLGIASGQVLRLFFDCTGISPVIIRI